MNNSDIKVYRPSLKRIYADVVISAVVAPLLIFPLLLGLAILFNNGDIIIRALPGLFGSIVGILAMARSLRALRSIVISSKAISGAKFLSFRRVGFPISDIDVIRTNKRNILEKLLGQQVIHSKNGEAILLYRRIFSPDMVEDILTRCNLESEHNKRIQRTEA